MARETTYPDGAVIRESTTFKTEFSAPSTLILDFSRSLAPTVTERGRISVSDYTVDAELAIGSRLLTRTRPITELREIVLGFAELSPDLPKLLLGQVDADSLCKRGDWESARVLDLGLIDGARTLRVDVTRWDGSVSVWVDTDRWCLLKLVEMQRTTAEELDRLDEVRPHPQPPSRPPQPGITVTTSVFRPTVEARAVPDGRGH